MSKNILWEYLEKLPEQETAWRNWQCNLADWYRFNTFYTHYLKVAMAPRQADELPFAMSGYN